MFSKSSLVFLLTFFSLTTQSSTQKICIVIPAYNEEQRITPTLKTYANFFQQQPDCNITMLVVCNNCSDNTAGIALQAAQEYPNIQLIDFKPGGKGFAVTQGFLWALEHDFDLIGFIDADMATLPEYFYDLIKACKTSNGAIASRYAPGAVLAQGRPLLRRLGGKLYNWILQGKLNIHYDDTQCGAKIFDYDTITKIAPHMQEKGWAFDLELLYLCKLFDKKITEVATTWREQEGTHLQLSAHLIKEFLSSPYRITKRHATLRKELKKQKELQIEPYIIQNCETL